MGLKALGYCSVTTRGIPRDRDVLIILWATDSTAGYRHILEVIAGWMSLGWAKLTRGRRSYWWVSCVVVFEPRISFIINNYSSSSWLSQDQLIKWYKQSTSCLANLRTSGPRKRARLTSRLNNERWPLRFKISLEDSKKSKREWWNKSKERC